MSLFFFSHCHLYINLYMLNCCVFIVQKEVLKALKQSLLAKLSQCVLGNLTEDSASQFAETLASLIKLSANIKDTRDLINSLPKALQKVDSFERYYLSLSSKVNYQYHKLLAKFSFLFQVATSRCYH